MTPLFDLVIGSVSLSLLLGRTLRLRGTGAKVSVVTGKVEGSIAEVTS